MVAVLYKLPLCLPSQRLDLGMKVLGQGLMVERASCSQLACLQQAHLLPLRLAGLYSASSSEAHAHSADLCGEPWAPVSSTPLLPQLSAPLSHVLSLYHLSVSHVEVLGEDGHH